jgi:hypothetical protein
VESQADRNEDVRKLLTRIVTEQERR